MRHQVDGRKFGRNTSHRVAMLKNLANSVIEKEQVVTTVAKAKEARRVVDRLITLGKSGALASRRLAFSRTRNKKVVDKLFDELATRYQERAGGYTRVMKLVDRRRGDAAEMAVLELVDHPPIDRKKKKPEEGADADKKQATAPSAPSDVSNDPYSRMRKAYSGTRKRGRAAVKAAVAANAEEQAKAKKTKKRREVRSKKSK